MIELFPDSSARIQSRYAPVRTFSTQPLCSRYHATVRRNPLSNSPAGRQPSSRLIFDASIAYRRVVTWAVCHKADELSAWTNRGVGAELINNVANGCYNIQVFALTITADIVCFPHAAVAQHGTDGRAVILHKEPIAHVAAVAINR